MSQFIQDYLNPGDLGYNLVYVERGQRRIPIQHAKRAVGRRVTQGGMSYFPLRVNTAGVIPPIFASSLLMLPLTVRQYSDSPTIQRFIDDAIELLTGETAETINQRIEKQLLEYAQLRRKFAEKADHAG